VKPTRFYGLITQNTAVQIAVELPTEELCKKGDSSVQDNMHSARQRGSSDGLFPFCLIISKPARRPLYSTYVSLFYTAFVTNIFLFGKHLATCFRCPRKHILSPCEASVTAFWFEAKVVTCQEMLKLLDRRTWRNSRRNCATWGYESAETPFGSNRARRLGGTCRLHLQSRRISQAEIASCCC
jgi:hypothetical protein